jgi:hypothetical protein
MIDVAVVPAGEEFDVTAVLGVADGVLEQAVQRGFETLGIRDDRAGPAIDQPLPVRGGPPPLDRPVQQRVEIQRRGTQLRVLLDHRQREQVGGDAFELFQLVEHHSDVLVDLRGDVLITDQLGVAAGNGQWSAQLMGGESHESALPITHPAFALGQGARLQVGCAAPAHVPHHREEYQAHQRNLGRLLPADDVVLDVAYQRDPGDGADCGEDEIGPGERPRLQAVHKRQADPHEMERHRLLARHDEHEDDVDSRERDPGAEQPAVSSRRRNIPHYVSSR